MGQIREADGVVVIGGTNDYGQGDAPIGSFSDRTPDTFYGACHDLYTKLIEKYPGKPFTEIQNRISAGTPFANTMVCALVNACPGYFPTTRAFHEGGYEAPVNGMCKLLEEMK